MRGFVLGLGAALGTVAWLYSLEDGMMHEGFNNCVVVFGVVGGTIALRCILEVFGSLKS